MTSKWYFNGGCLFKHRVRISIQFVVWRPLFGAVVAMETSEILAVFSSLIAVIS